MAPSVLAADPKAPNNADGMPSRTINVSLGVTDVRGSIPKGLMQKLSVKGANMLAKRTIETLTASGY